MSVSDTVFEPWVVITLCRLAEGDWADRSTCRCRLLRALTCENRPT